MFKRVFIIINPASGREEPVLSYLNKVLQKCDFYWEITITKVKHDPYKFTKQALRRNFDLIVVYGGDGTVVEVARALYKRQTPLLVLPGGTANVLAKEIGIPPDTQSAVKLLENKNLKLKTVDVGLLREKPFILRINVGIAAEMVKNTSRDLKDKLGILAYSVSALKHAFNHDVYKFKMNFDGKEIDETGVALMVTNAGNVGFSGFSLHPHVDITDGFLDVILLKRAAVKPIFTWLKSNFTGKKPQGEIRSWKAKKVNIKFSPNTGIICDDVAMNIKDIEAKISPQGLRVVVP